jgi:flavin reductase (DIM6/NTAB) family NADH-FMN oxidoreductase RutF
VTATTADRSAGVPPEAAFVDAMAALAGGVCVVTAPTPEGRPVGFTSTAVMSLSREPQLLAVGVNRAGRTLPVLLGGRRFALNILHAGAEHVARRFAEGTADRFADLEWSADGTGLPLLRAYSSCVLVCRVEEDLPAGDHRLLIAAVERIMPGTGGPTALVHHGRRYHALDAAPAA